MEYLHLLPQLAAFVDKFTGIRLIEHEHAVHFLYTDLIVLFDPRTRQLIFAPTVNYGVFIRHCPNRYFNILGLDLFKMLGFLTKQLPRVFSCAFMNGAVALSIQPLQRRAVEGINAGV